MYNFDFAKRNKRGVCKIYYWVYAIGRLEEEDGKTFVCDKPNKAITYVFCRDLHLTLMFLVFYKKTCLKEGEVWRKVFLEHNYCHVFHTKIAAFFPLPSCCVSSVLARKGTLCCTHASVNQLTYWLQNTLQLTIQTSLFRWMLSDWIHGEWQADVCQKCRVS